MSEKTHEFVAIGAFAWGAGNDVESAVRECVQRISVDHLEHGCEIFRVPGPSHGERQWEVHPVDGSISWIQSGNEEFRNACGKMPEQNAREHALDAAFADVCSAERLLRFAVALTKGARPRKRLERLQEALDKLSVDLDEVSEDLR